jgi:hypothetical protein
MLGQNPGFFEEAGVLAAAGALAVSAGTCNAQPVQNVLTDVQPQQLGLSERRQTRKIE